MHRLTWQMNWRKKWELVHKRIKARNVERDCLSTGNPQWFGSGELREGRGGVNWGWRPPERLSLLVLAAVAPAAHGGCGAGRPIHPAHQGRTQHRKTGRKRGHSSRTHCLSDWRPGWSNATALCERGRGEEVQDGDGDVQGYMKVLQLSKLKTIKE